jgi:hypothetical protein
MEKSMTTPTAEQAERSRGERLDVFQLKQEQAQEAFRLWQAVSHALAKLLVPRMDAKTESARAERAERAERARAENNKRREHDNRFVVALGEFTHAMQAPELILATTGTTSSGKSTLVNFLCGSEIMPVAVGEKSAGVVAIHHSEHRKIVIAKTPGATWPTGEWPRVGHAALTDEAIRQLLDGVMTAYNNLRDKPGEPACPLIELYYPTRLGGDPRLLGLPGGFVFRILDLPGLKYVGDEGNSSVIRQACKEALCLVLYDSAQVDPRKKQILLEQVADQVRELGGSPARMLFVLNRIDVFGQNIGGQAEEEEFVRETEQGIRGILLNKLPGNDSYIRRLKPVKLSAKPGLLALVAKTHTGNDRLQALQLIDDTFRKLIPPEVRRHLPGAVEDWKPAHVQGVTEGVLRTSYCLAFEERLRLHIADRLPELVIPQAVDRFRGRAAFEAVSWADVLTQAELNSSAERYQRECDRVAQASTDLAQLRHESSRLLRAPFERMLATTGEWKSIVDNTEKQYSPSLEGKLAPLYAWREDPKSVVSRVMASVQDSLTEGRPLLHAGANPGLIDQLPTQQRTDLAQAFDALRKAGYEGDVARNGSRRTAANAAEQQELQKIHSALRDFGKCLERALAELVHHARQNALERVYDASELLFDRHRMYVEKSAHDVMKKLELELNPEMPQVALERVQAQLEKREYDLDAGLKITHHKETVQSGTKKVEIGRRTETWGEAVRAESSMGFFGSIMGKVKGTVRWVSRSRSIPIFDEKPVYEDRVYDKTTLEPIKDLVHWWAERTSRNDPALLAEFGQWFLRQVEEINERIATFQTLLLLNYQKQLDAVHAEAKETSDNERNAWTDVETKLKEFREGFARLASLDAHD